MGVICHPQEVRGHEVAFPSSVSGFFAKEGFIDKKIQLLTHPGERYVETILVHKTSGFAHETQNDNISFLPLALINGQHWESVAVLFCELEHSFQLKLNLALLILVL